MPRIIIFLLSITLCGGVSAQKLSEMQKIFPSRAMRYDVQNGLPDNCVRSVFMDGYGKLNVVPCHHYQLAHDIQYYQFNGFEVMKSMDQNWDLPSGVINVLCGVEEDGKVFGYFYRRNPLGPGFESTFYRFNSIDGTTEQMPLQYEGKPVMAKSIFKKNNAFFLIGFTSKMSVFRIHNNELVLEAELPDSFATMPLMPNIPLYVTEDKLWVANYVSNKLICIDRMTNEIKDYPFSGHGAGGNVAVDRFIRFPSGQLVFGMPTIGVVQSIDQESGTVTPLEFDKIDDAVTNTFVYKDERHNILTIGEDERGDLFGYLQEVNGKKWNYTPVLQELQGHLASSLHRNDLVSEDFREKVFVTGYSFMVVEVSSSRGIETFESKPLRGLMELQPGLVYMAKRGFLNLRGETPQIDPVPMCLNGGVLDGDLIEDDAGHIWQVHTVKKLVEYDAEFNVCTEHTLQENCLRIANYNADYFLLISTNNEVLKFEKSTGATHKLLDVPIKGFVNQVFRDSQGRIWIAGSEGLFRLDEEARQLIPQKLPVYQSRIRVQHIHEGEDGRLWLGTLNQGVIVLDPMTGQWHVINEKKGLSNNTVVSVMTDEDGVKWAGTFHGITLISDSLIVLGHVFSEDGLISNECNRWSATKLQDGRMCFGTPKGISVLDPELVKEKVRQLKQPMIYLGEIAIGDSTIKGNLNQFGNEKIVLAANNRNLKISCALSSYAAPLQQTYAYKIEGRDQDWNYMGGVHVLALTDLPAGRYDILIKGANYRGQWSSNVLTIPVFGREYFYKQWWFYVLLAVPFLVFGLLWVYRLRKEKELLEDEVERRTETIRQQTDDLLQLDEIKSRLYTNITHEFRTPLTVISGLADRFKEDPKAPDLIKRNANSLLNLVNQLLELRKLESGILKPTWIQGDLTAYLGYIGESFRSMAEADGINFHFLPPSEPVVMDFDPEKISRVFNNLLSNAIKFTDEGGDIYLQVEEVSKEEDLVLIKVRDTGIGIPEDQMDKIFDRFYQVDDSTTRKHEGTGIGLTLVRELVELMGGTISVKSRQGHGTTFLVALPVHHLAPESAPEYLMTDFDPIRVKNEGIDISNGETPSMDDLPLVLIVEDNPDVVHYIGTCLKGLYRVIIAMDGAEGIHKAIDQVPDLIISDLMMPEKNGFELCETLKEDERTSHIPIIILTAKADAESRLKGFKRGADAYLAKPFNESELLVRMEKLISLRITLQERYKAADFSTAKPELEHHQEDAFISKFRELLLTHLDDENFGVAQMGSAMMVSRTQLHNKISALTGKPVSLFMRTIRLQEAQKLLKDNDLSIAEVAYRVGFKDPKYFTRVFKDEYGIPPSEWVAQQ